MSKDEIIAELDALLGPPDASAVCMSCEETGRYLELKRLLAECPE